MGVGEILARAGSARRVDQANDELSLHSTCGHVYRGGLPKGGIERGVARTAPENLRKSRRILVRAADWRATALGVLLLIVAGFATGQPSPGEACDATCIARMNAQLNIYREERSRHE